MREFTKEIRQEILDEFAARHGGHFYPKVFLQEVRLSNGSHRAWSWFEWNDGKAAEAHRIWQAEKFTQGLRVKFEVTTESRSVSKVTVYEAPAFISPIAGRKDGGGYFALDPSNPEHLRELTAQAVASLDTWINRYGAVLELKGGSIAMIREVQSTLAQPVTPAISAA